MPKNQKLEEHIQFKRQSVHGDHFDISDLSEPFKPFFRQDVRIKVQFSTGEVKTGYVGISTGWKPIFLLRLTRRSIGSTYTLSANDKIIAVKKGSKYVPYGG